MTNHHDQRSAMGYHPFSRGVTHPISREMTNQDDITALGCDRVRRVVYIPLVEAHV